MIDWWDSWSEKCVAAKNVLGNFIVDRATLYLSIRRKWTRLFNRPSLIVTHKITSTKYFPKAKPNMPYAMAMTWHYDFTIFHMAYHIHNDMHDMATLPTDKFSLQLCMSLHDVCLTFVAAIAHHNLLNKICCEA